MNTEIRRQGIGGSDVAAILGLSPWSTPLDVWQEKTGRAAPRKATAAMRRGLLLESLVVDLYREETSKTVTRQQEFIKDGLAQGHIDGIAEDRLLEAKTGNERTKANWGLAGTDEIPDYYLTQVHWYLGLTKMPVADIALLLGDDDFRIYTVKADTEVYGVMKQRAEQWWRDYVVKDIAPEPSNGRDIKILWPSSKENTVEATKDDLVSIERLKFIRNQMKTLEAEGTKIADEIRMALKDAEAMTYAGRTVLTYKSQSTNRLDIESLKTENPEMFESYLKKIESRVMRIR